VKTRNVISPTKRGKVKIKPQKRADGTEYWTIRCRKTGIPERRQYQTFDNYSAAVDEAQNIEDLLITGQGIANSDQIRLAMQRISPKLADLEKEFPDLDYARLFEEAIEWERFTRNVKHHKKQIDARFYGYEGERNMIWYDYYSKMVSTKLSVRNLWEVAEEYIKDKYESGRADYSPYSRISTKNHLNSVKEELISIQFSDLEIAKKRITSFLDRATQKRGKNKGQSYNVTTKVNISRDLVTFGNWIKNKYDPIKENPFDGMNSVYQTPKYVTVATFSNKEVKQIFQLAASTERYRKILPYLTMIFWATVRPFEINDPGHKGRALCWDAFQDWKTDCKVLKDNSFYFKITPIKEVDGQRIRMSKTARTRNALLVATGFEWIKYAFNGKLPTEGEIYLSRKILESFKKESGLSWETDKPRHTLLSHCRANEDWIGLTSDGFWCDRAAHSNAIFKKHYEAVSNPIVSKEYFELTPEKVLK